MRNPAVFELFISTKRFKHLKPLAHVKSDERAREIQATLRD